MSDNWKSLHTPEAHKVALSGRPVLLYGMPRYGFTAAREAIGHFETGRGWRESATDRPFDATHWMHLPTPPESPSHAD